MSLPNLLYVSDVAVESTLGGELLLYRLLRKYPSDRLTIAQSNVGRSSPEERLPNVQYERYAFANTRLLDSRLTRWYGSWLHQKAKWVPSKLKRLVDQVRPEAILTVWHDYSWLTAARIARNRELPLHLILHDDAPNLKFRTHPSLQALHEGDFGRVYRQAESRLCVSPAMERVYEARYGVSGTVLYPARGWEAAHYERPPERIKQGGELTIGYAGALHAPGFKRGLEKVAEAVAPFNGTVFVYSNAPPEKTKRESWVKDNVKLKGFIHPENIVRELRESVDILFAVSSFEGNYREIAKTNFQSKMVDYTATGLPILLWGPEDSSTIRWAREKAGTAEVVTSPNTDDLQNAVEQLVTHPELRYEYGRTALKIGNRCFSAEEAWSTFSEAVSE